MVRVIQDPINSFQLENVNYNFSLIFSYVRALSGGQDIIALVQQVEQALQTAQSLNVQGQELVDELTPLLTQLNEELEKVGELKFLGQWSSSNSYKTLNIVSYNGESFIAKRDNSNVTPVEGDDWGLISQRGAQGIQGPQGEPGRGLIILGLLPNVAALPSTAQPGDAYIVENTPNNELYVWVSGSFVNMGPFGSGSGIMKATTAEAIAGTNDENYITPLTAKAAIENTTNVIENNLNNHINNYLAHGISATTTGTANDYIINPAVPLDSYQRTLKITLFVNVENTGPSTLNISSLGAKSLKKNDGSDYSQGELKINTPYTFVYNGTDFLADSASGGGEEVLLEFEDFYNRESEITRYTISSGLPQSVYYNAGASVSDYAIFAGGLLNSSTSISNVAAFNRDRLRSTVTSLSPGRGRLAGASAGNNAVFAGGTNADSSTSTIYTNVDIYNSTLVRNSGNALSIGRYYIASTNFQNAAVFAGGYTHTAQISAVDVLMEDGVRNTITPLSSPAGLAAASKIGDYLLVAGGTSGSNVFLNTVNVYNKELVKMTNAANLLQSKYQLSGANTSRHAVFLGGNAPGVGVYNTIEAYDSDLTKSNPTTLSSGRTAGTANSINGGIIYAGGSDGTDAISTTEHINASLIRTSITNISFPVRDPSSATLGNIMFIGGGRNDNSSNNVNAYSQTVSAEILVTKGSKYAFNNSAQQTADSNKKLIFNTRVNGYVNIKKEKFIGGF